MCSICSYPYRFGIGTTHVLQSFACFCISGQMAMIKCRICSYRRRVAPKENCENSFTGLFSFVSQSGFRRLVQSGQCCLAPRVSIFMCLSSCVSHSPQLGSVTYQRVCFLRNLWWGGVGCYTHARGPCTS